MKNNYNIPATRKDKVELLTAIMKGQKTINDLKEAGYIITMWREDDLDPEYMQTFDGKIRITKIEFEARKLTSKAMSLTLELN